MYKVRVYDKDGNRRYNDPIHPSDYDAAFSTYQAAERFVEYRERQNNRCVIIHEREEPDWTELMVICDNCGHAIHVKREEI